MGNGRSRRDAVEVTVRFADTLLQVTRVAHGKSFRIGTAPGVDLPLDVSPLTAFPLIGSTPEDFVVRCPAGVPAIASAHDLASAVGGGEHRLQPGTRLELGFGRVTLSIAHVAGASPLALRRLDRRPVPFAIASLVLHVFGVLLAMWSADLEPVTMPVAFTAPDSRPARIARFPPNSPPPRPAKRRTPKRSGAAATPDAREAAPDPDLTPEQQVARRRGEATEGARHAGFLPSASLDDLGMIIGTKDLAAELADVGPIYDEEAATKGDFGNSNGHFDPGKDPAFDSVKTGPYATVGTGRGAGAHYRLPAHGKFREVARPPIMGLTCDDAACTSVGGIDRGVVRDVIEKRYVELVRCYERHARRAPRIELTLRFEIGTDGKADDMRIDGVGGVGSCVARIVQRVTFPTTARATRVTYPMAFWRT